MPFPPDYDCKLCNNTRQLGRFTGMGEKSKPCLRCVKAEAWYDFMAPLRTYMHPFRTKINLPDNCVLLKKTHLWEEDAAYDGLIIEYQAKDVFGSHINTFLKRPILQATDKYMRLPRLGNFYWPTNNSNEPKPKWGIIDSNAIMKLSIEGADDLMLDCHLLILDLAGGISSFPPYQKACARVARIISGRLGQGYKTWLSICGKYETFVRSNLDADLKEVVENSLHQAKNLNPSNTAPFVIQAKVEDGTAPRQLMPQRQKLQSVQNQRQAPKSTNFSEKVLFETNPALNEKVKEFAK